MIIVKTKAFRPSPTVACVFVRERFPNMKHYYAALFVVALCCSFCVPGGSRFGSILCSVVERLSVSV